MNMIILAEEMIVGGEEEEIYGKGRMEERKKGRNVK